MSLLSSALTSLDQSQSAEQLMQNLNNLEVIYKTITDKLNAPPADATAPAAQPTPSTGQITLPPIFRACLTSTSDSPPWVAAQKPSELECKK